MFLLWQYIRQYKKVLFGALALATVNQVFSLIDPQIFQLIIDRFATRPSDYTSQQFLSGVGLLLLLGVGVAFVSRTAKSFQDYYVNVITQRVGTNLYANSVSHAFGLAYSVFEDQRSGELLLKLQKARDDAKNLITSSINIVFLSFIGTAFVIAYAFFVNWQIGLFYLALIPIIGLSSYAISRRIKAAQKKIILQTAELAGATTETLRNVELVKSLGLEQQEITRLNLVNEKILALELQKIKYVRLMSFIQGTMINALRSSIILLTMWLIFRDVITLGQYFTLFIYSFFIFNPLMELNTVMTQLQEARASMAELKKILALTPEHVPTDPQPIDVIKQIDFQQVNFQYQSAHIPSVNDVTFTIKAGETVAFVGPSGSGKSTILKLIAGLYQPNSGMIHFNDLDAKNLDYVRLRKRLGLVSQETQLFAGSLRDNLLFVRPNATDQECLAALDKAQARGLVDRGDKGLDTRIGEGGIKISGGERQRLAIARALLRQPEIIIFDEATSSLDSITEQAITETIQAIEKLHPEVMRILVAHRLSTVAHADRIYVLEKGRIIEQGNHQELLKKKGLYAALWRQQSGEAQ